MTRRPADGGSGGTGASASGLEDEIGRAAAGDVALDDGVPVGLAGAVHAVVGFLLVEAIDGGGDLNFSPAPGLPCGKRTSASLHSVGVPDVLLKYASARLVSAHFPLRPDSGVVRNPGQ